MRSEAKYSTENDFSSNLMAKILVFVTFLVFMVMSSNSMVLE